MCRAEREQSLKSSHFRGLRNKHLDSSGAGEANAALFLGD